MILKNRTLPLQIQTFYFFHKSDCMRIPHRHLLQFIVIPVHLNRDSLPRNGYPHVHCDLKYFSVFHLKFQLFQPCTSFNRQVGFAGQPLVINKLSHTANAISAHFPLRPIRIEHLHPKIPCLGRADANQPITANAKMPVGDLDCQRRQVLRHLFGAIQIDIVIAQSLHFCKSHYRHFLFSHTMASIVQTPL